MAYWPEYFCVNSHNHRHEQQCRYLCECLTFNALLERVSLRASFDSEYISFDVSLRYIRFLVFSNNFRDVHFKYIYEAKHDENMRAKLLFAFAVCSIESNWFGLLLPTNFEFEYFETVAIDYDMTAVHIHHVHNGRFKRKKRKIEMKMAYSIWMSFILLVVHRP